MMRLYFVCMGNYYRSRLAEELALYYASQYGVKIEADSGGLSQNPNPRNVGPMAPATLEYLASKNVFPQRPEKMPKKCNLQDVSMSDIVICTDEAEQKHLFLAAFPEYKGELICWQAHDISFDPWMHTPDMINDNVQALIKKLAAQ